ncbi:MAG: sugar ABC transporter permease [Acetatifactor sp.]|nr:sugar ABC transporter permease [Acetatifactor sp.]
MNKRFKKAVITELEALAFLAPFLIIFCVFFLWAVMKGVYISVHKWTILGKVSFVGASNYIRVLTSGAFYRYLWNSLYYVIISTPILIVVGLGLALVINAKIKGRTFYRVAYFMPYVLSVSVVSFIWLKLFDSNRGLLNVILLALGKKTPVNWLTDTHVVWWSIVLASVWWGVGFVMVLYLAGLQEIPESYYEAASIDGASDWQKFWYITLPCLKGVTKVQVFFQIIAGLKLFGQTQMMTGGGPGDTTKTMVMHIYNTGFKKDQFGEASAISILFCLFMLIFTILQNQKRREE